jgi:1,4-dihydroxy-2-naphthoate octaprenyltransferase
MWRKALQVIPQVSKSEWDELDLISKWLIATRAAVLIMTFLSGVLAGLFVWHDGLKPNLGVWLILIIGLVLAHAANNLFNDYTDYIRGVDVQNYFRTMYGPQPLADGLLNKKQHLRYFAITGVLAIVCGGYLLLVKRGDPLIWLFIGLGAFFVLFYTWPLKYIAMGELAVFLVWGPLMIGGGYYVLSSQWSWNVVWASMPYVLGVTTVIFGKHIDKINVDKAKKIHTLPVIIGEKRARIFMIGMMVLPYLIVLILVVIKYFTPIMLLVVMAIPTFTKLYPQFIKPRPEQKPEGFPEGQGGWPLYFAPQAFINNRAFGMWFMIAFILEIVIRVIPNGSWW